MLKHVPLLHYALCEAMYVIDICNHCIRILQWHSYDIAFPFVKNKFSVESQRGDFSCFCLLKYLAVLPPYEVGRGIRLPHTLMMWQIGKPNTEFMTSAC